MYIRTGPRTIARVQNGETPRQLSRSRSPARRGSRSGRSEARRVRDPVSRYRGHRRAFYGILGGQDEICSNLLERN